MGNQIKWQMGFSVDKTGLKDFEKALTDILLKAKDPKMQINDELKEASKTAQKLSDILDKSYNKDLGTINVARFNKELTSSNISLAKAKSDLEKFGSVGANAYNLMGSQILNTNVQLKQSSKLLDDMAKSMGNTIKWGITSTIFNSITDSIARAYDYTVNLNKSLNDIRIVTGQSSEEMNKFAETANNAAKTLGASTLDYTNAALIYYQQGLSAEETAERARVTVEAANVTGQTGAEVSEQLTAVWNGYKVSAQETELYVDKLAAVAASTAADLEELSTGMSKVASAANSSGVNVDQLNGILSTVISVTREAPETIGASFKTIFARLGDLELDGEDEFGVSLGQVSSQMEELGIEILDQKGQMRDMGDIIEDTAEKWQGWTQAQRQAAAVAMAGKMQYSRLIALFDNWDMYTDAVNTSTSAIGTLQEQQDIYMESTSAKLNKLRATWQDLYDGILDDDEINTGIDALTNLVQTFDNFIDSFGGGLSSIAGLGTIVANVFNKQISQALNRAIANQNKYKENTELLKKKMETIQIGVADSGENATPEQLANMAGYEEELKYAQMIQGIQKGLSEEQYNALVIKQQEIGELERELTLLQNQVDLALKKNNFTEEDLNDMDAFNEYIDDQIKKRKSERIEISKKASIVKQEIDTEKSKEQIVKSLSKLYDRMTKLELSEAETSSLTTIETRKQLELLIKEIDKQDDIKDYHNDIFKLLRKINSEEYEGVKALEEKYEAGKLYMNSLEKIEQLQTQKQDRGTEFEFLYESGKSANAVATSVSAITTALSSVTSTWATVNSLYQTWNDENLSFSDKIFQTISSVGFMLPNIITTLGELNQLNTAATSLLAKRNALQQVDIALTKANTAEMTKQQVIEQADAILQSKGIKLSQEEIVTRLTKIGVLKAETTGTVVDTGAKVANTVATKGLTGAMVALKGVMLAHPITAIIIALTAMAGAISLVTSIQKKNIEQKREDSKASIERQNKIQEEIKANDELYNSYLKVSEAYKIGTSSKEDMAAAADSLIGKVKEEDIAVAKLTGNYDKLTEAVRRNQKQEAEKGLKSAESERDNAGYLVETTARKDRGRKVANNQYVLDMLGGLSTQDDKKLMNEFKKIESFKGTDAEAFFSTDFNAESIVKLYDDVQKAINDANLSTIEKQDSEIYQHSIEWLNKMKEDVEIYKATLTDISQYEKQISAIDIDFTNIESYADFMSKRTEFIESLKGLEELDGKTEEEIENIANTYITGLSEQASNYMTSVTGIEELVNKFGEDSRKTITDTMNSLSAEDIKMLFTIGVDNIKSLELLDEYIALAKNKVDTENTEELQKISGILSTGDDTELSEEQLSLLEKYEKEYEKLGEIQDRTSHDYLKLLREIKEQEEDNNLSNLNDTRDILEKEYEIAEEELQKLLDNPDANVVEITAKTDEVEEALDALEEQDRQIKVAIDADLATDVEDAFDLADEIDRLTQTFTDDLEYTYDEAQKLIEAGYGEMFTNAQKTADGTIKVNKSIMNAFIDDKQTEIAADKEAKIAQLEDQKKLLQAQRQALVAKLNALKEAANAENAVDAATALEKAKNADKEYQAKNEALNEMLDDEAEGASETENINAELFNNLGGMYETNNKNLQNAESAATTKQRNEASKRIANNKAVFDSYNKIAEAVRNSAEGNTTAWNDTTGMLQGGGGTVSSESDKIEAKKHAAEKIEKKDLTTLTQDLFSKDTNSEYQQTINKLISQTEAQINGIDAQIGAADAGIAALQSSWDTLNKTQRDAGLGKDKDKGGSKDKEPEIIEYLEDEKDLYHDIDIEIKQVETSLSKLEKQQEKLFGKDLLDNLNSQLKDLDKQIDNYNEKIRIAKGEAEQLKSQLAGKGVAFNADGTIANYASVYNEQLAYVNSVIAQYNAMDAEAQEKFKDTLEQVQNDFDTFVDNIGSYDDLITDTIPGLEENIQDALDKQIELKITGFNMEIEIRLDMAEAERDWNEFKRTVIDGLKDDDIFGNAKAKLQDYFSYYKDGENGIIQANARHVQDILEQLKQMDETGVSNVYGDNRTGALEDLQTYYKQLMEDLQSVEELVDEIKQSYLDMMDEAAEKFEEQIGMYEQVKDIISHDMNVISLVYGENSYDKLAQYYKMQEDNNNKQLSFQRQQVEFWRQQMNTLEEGTEEWDKAKENWIDAVSEWNDSIENAIENLQDKYLNAINEVFEKLNDKVTGGLGLDYTSEQWDLINENADQYLDTINSMYEIQKLQEKYQEGIDNSDDIAAQQKLTQLMNEQITALEEQDKLSKYDIERANLKYEIAMKQIALEESQRNKSTMRLKRDSQGNYSYQYVADDDQVNAIEQEISDLYNRLYNLDVNQYRDKLGELYDVWDEFQQKMAEAAQINDPEMRQEKELLLREQYGELINGLVEQNEIIRKNIHESAFIELADLYNVDYNSFAQLEQDKQDLLIGSIIPQWTSGVQQMADVFAGEGGFTQTCENAMIQLDNVTKEYEVGLQNLEYSANISFDAIANGQDKVINQTQQLIDDNNELINGYKEELNAIQSVINQLNTLINKYGQAKAEAIGATQAAYKYWQQQNQQAANGTKNGSNNTQNNPTPTQNAAAGSGSSSAGTGVANATAAGGGDGILSIGDTATYSGRYYYDSYGTSPAGSRYSGVANGIVVDKINNNPYGVHIHSADGKFKDLGWIKKSQLTGFDTGGYTGNWSDSSGKLALLHKKEMVLNSQDTLNMLNAVTIMRDITNSVNSSVLSKLASLGTIGKFDMGVSSGEILQQDVHIEANFPGVKSSQEIEDAINNLVNMASMKVNKK